MGMSKEARVLLYTKMYTAVSKATAETKNANGESVKTTYNGTLADLFDGICNHRRTTTAFMWAITHKTDALPTQLFRAVDHGTKGYEISRVHSGFYDDQRKHIVGTNLIPFIMDAMKLWEPTPRAKKEPVVIQPVEAKKLPIKVISEQEMIVNHECELATALTGLSEVSDDTLAYFGKDAKERYEKAKADLDAYCIEIQRREQERKKVAKKQELLKTISELIAGEGFTLDEIMQIV